MELEEARRKVFEDCVDDPKLNEVFDWSERTKARHLANGMPFLKLGAKRLYHIPSVAKWVLAQTRSHRPRGRGRPRKGDGAREARP